MKKFITVFLIVILLFASTFSGCTLETKRPEKTTKKPETTYFSFKDDLNRELKIKVPVSSVVSLAPSHTEVIFALGKGQKLKGVTVFCNYPEEAKKKPKVGDFFNPNVEMIVKLKPDLVLAVKGIQNSLIRTLENNGIQVAVFDATSLKDCAKDIKIIGKLLGAEKKAEEIGNAIVNASSNYEKTGKKVFIEISPDPLITAGKNSFISDAIKAAGGINVGDEFGEGYPIVNPEKLFEINPDVYLVSKSLNLKYEDIAKRPGFSKLKCIKNRKVFVLPDDDIVQRPGPRIIKGIEVINELINR
ncbi:MAG: cobalamin-binding protein [Actinobacteria bacterium]|nr:cobalamin-binding protein [Actinomycetota bacterium]